MKSVLECDTRHELIRRINSLTPESRPLWGTMNVAQMVKHCTIADEMYLGRKTYPRTFRGILFGRFALRSLLQENAIMPQGADTLKVFRVDHPVPDLELRRQEWITFINEYENFSLPYVTHWYFGRMTREEIGYFSYKHSDHHLRQFNV